MPWARASDGVRIHYEVTGFRRRPPVVLIQGLGAEKNAWNIQRAALALRWRTIALDNRGAGRSDKPDGMYDLEQMADDVIAVLDDAGVDSAHVVGLSMGGGISQIVALKYPQRVRSLTLVATACRNHEWREELLASWAQIAETNGMATLGREAARWTIGPRSFRRLVPTFGWFGALQFLNPAGAFVSQVRAILRTNDTGLSSELANITCPTLVVVGNQDILTPRGDAEEIASLIPTAELAVISGGAHGLIFEHASTFNRILVEFLGRAERAHAPRGDAVRSAL